MLLVNPKSSFQWSQPLDINGAQMMGIYEKQGFSFQRMAYDAIKSGAPPELAEDQAAGFRRSLRPLSRRTLRYAREEYADRQVIPMPRYFIIEPTAFCNKACPFCSIHAIQRFDERGSAGNTMMMWSDFVTLMDEIREAGGAYGLSLYQLGEPLLWRGRRSGRDGLAVDLRDMIRYAKDSFEVVNISTNGDVWNMHYLLDSPVDDVIISIDGTTEATYLANRPSTKEYDPGAFLRTIQRVTDFLDRKVNAKNGNTYPNGLQSYVRLQIINKQNTRDEIVPFIRHWIQHPGVDDVFVKNLDAMTPWVGDAAVSAVEAQSKAHAVATMPCQHLWAVGSMTASGSFNACCHDARTELTDRETWPNIRTMRFAEWWRGPFMTKLREEHSTGTFRAPCATCHERDPWLG